MSLDQAAQAVTMAQQASNAAMVALKREREAWQHREAAFKDVTKENAELKNQLDTLRKRVAELQAAVASMRDHPAVKKGEAKAALDEANRLEAAAKEARQKADRLAKENPS